MQLATGLELLARIGTRRAETFEIPAEHYTSEARLARERTVLAGPRILAVSSEIAPGACLPVGDLLLVRDADRVLRGFRNACRHRATRLVDAPCAAKAIVCPYHAWTYDLTGALIHVPHAEAFGAAAHGRDLHAVPIVERHGLVWSAEPALDALAADLAVLELERSVVYKRERTTHACNWKLVMDAFLEGYHVRILHRDSVGRYFVDCSSHAEPVGTHMRGITERRHRGEVPAELRARATPSLYIFPAHVIIEHPDFVSVITLEPLAPDRTVFDHAMLVPADRLGETDHWQKNWDLIHAGVFVREDLWVCEQIQKSLAAGATDHLLFGALEAPVAWFHRTLSGLLSAS